MSTAERQAKIRIVLVNTSHPGNIGGAARAMKNMGLAELYLVEPREYPAPRAVWRAAGARDVLANAKIVGSVDEAIKDCGLVIGTSARERRIPWPLINPRECGDKIWKEAKSHQVALLFGREDRGLTNSELQKCHYHVHIPSNPDYSSLNLATAVQVLSYEIRMASLTRKNGKLPEMNEWDQPLATADELELFHDHLASTMADLKFYDPDNPKQLLTRMRRLFNRTRMDKMEVSMLRGLLSAAQRKQGK
ncbi:MAG: tRNA (cytosine(32)/uridine(32)-2'-O)-methyltransferase TrmJ [Porticoccaceae bacterium]|jgi:tRNA (cytidine32/uridine32-2'-O)-methyltransferase|nr:tRNA (cytosine(32)/uridine(32)-2'-O)-methyltransferase TrmJ [Porticoccaceae bacterium]MBT3798681.1 tRNA (cytosine(32)/uridine(32)-2'-O)-methyltransferase TrmJ [Porticoccaceae bacterium]MBT4163731.1 tRNA (cytosine(32)/uridine(32)-2'-O)-methyltransferase TrmJ [Porticoccaceae bacterium]MBT4212004.1 tRNA (cytosine(32)/uridine(32)-2'-O)-methyltransferase TrmJ [Porticoccaceae bacterium]MBT4590613.1 tRNA (cytosine(32)/uridine(32)-2'-O)-methyltransferase TrmJ [Porticoccaceae bacterium]